MLERLSVKNISVGEFSAEQLVDIEVTVIGTIDKEELDSLRYVIENDYEILLYAMRK